MAYNQKLRQVLNADWTQWLDGCFISATENPNDIDLINLISNPDRYFGDGFFTKLRRLETPQTKPYLDAYFLPIYAETDRRFSQTQADLYYWRKQFGRDRHRNPKAILQIKHTFL